GMLTTFLAAAPSSSSSAEGRESPIIKIPPRPLPPAMLAAAIPPRSDSSTPTRPVRLAELLAQPAPRNQQLETILVYWDLAAAVATVQFRKEELARLQNLRVFSGDQQAYQTVLSQAETALQTAETALAAAQRRLAEKMGWDPKSAPPWPVDKPHIGPYWTQLASLFSGRTVPRPLRLIDRCLPWWQKAIDRRAEAIYAAQDALDAFTEAYHQGRTDLRQVLWMHARWTEQHTAFLQATLAYNAQIAEFVLTVAPTQTQGASLVSMLILTNDRSQGTAGNRQSDARGAFWRQESDGSGDSGVQPAGYEEPLAPNIIPAPQPEPLPQPGSPGTGGAKQEPTLAPPRELPTHESGVPLVPSRQEPTLAPPKESPPAAKPTEPIPSSPSPPSSIPPKAPESPNLRPLVPITESSGPSTPTPASSGTSEASKSTSGEPPKTGGEKPVPYETKRPPGPRPDFQEESVVLYPALVRASPSVQVKQLALSFHGPINPSEKVRQETLLACLQRAPAGQRRELIEAYWMLWQQWAELAALAQQREILDELGRLTLQQRNRPLGAETMLQWRAAQLAEDADRMEARIRLLEREEKLAQYVNASGEAILAPATLPHTGPYQLRLESQPKKVAESWPVRRAAGLIPALYTSLQEQAKAVVLADQTRSEVLSLYRQGQRSLQDVLAACDQQKQAALEFLQTLADYNQAIADYVVLVAPAALPAERFVQTLVTDK
ncbi:MAG TPA: hypothetical protein PK777_06245, partial [Thermoguttaceae bacterium]|nr:hypothetical protein [Thermoguttaceae bacterium]